MWKSSCLDWRQHGWMFLEKNAELKFYPLLFHPVFFWGAIFFSGGSRFKNWNQRKISTFSWKKKKSMNFTCKLCIFLCLVVFHSAPLSSQAYQSSRGSFNTSSSTTKQTSKIKRTQKNMFFLSGVCLFLSHAHAKNCLPRYLYDYLI